MTDNQFILSEASIYLDTSFILYGLYESIDHNPTIVTEAQQIIGLLLMRDNFYISNIVLNELFNVLERTGFQVFIDKMIITSLGISIDDWKSLTKKDREGHRINYTNNNGYNVYKDIKTWRQDPSLAQEYKVLVIGEFENIIDSLGDNLKIVSSFRDDAGYFNVFLSSKKINKSLDSNDINHYLLCCEYDIKGILTCDNDFKALQDTNRKVIVLDSHFRLYTS